MVSPKAFGPHRIVGTVMSATLMINQSISKLESIGLNQPAGLSELGSFLVRPPSLFLALLPYCQFGSVECTIGNAALWVGSGESWT